MSYTDWVVDSGKNRRIFTFYELEILEVMKEPTKGDVTGRQLVMRTLGGEKGGVGLQVPGTAHFDRGEDVVVLLGPSNKDGSHDVRGLMMGKFEIRRNEQGEDVLFGPGLNATSSEEITDDHAKGGNSGTRWTLDSLRTLIAQDSKQNLNSSSKSANLPSVPSPGVTNTSSSQSKPTTASPLQLKETEGPAEDKKGGTQVVWIVMALLAVGILTAWFLKKQ